MTMELKPMPGTSALAAIGSVLIVIGLLWAIGGARPSSPQRSVLPVPVVVRNGTDVVVAPVGRWSEAISTNGRPFRGVPRGDVLVRNERGQEFQAGPNSIPDIGRSESLRYKSRGDAPVEVVITFLK
jgi:hypothetical protein